MLRKREYPDLLLRQRLDRLEAECKRLSSENESLRRKLQETIGKQQTAIERFDLRIAQVHARANQAFHLSQSILNSRIWKVLTGAGGLLLRGSTMLRGNTAPQQGSSNSSSGPESIHVHCEEPAPEQQPVSGQVVISGWAVAASGIDTVSVRVGDLQPGVRSSLYRPEIAAQYRYPGADRPGFHCVLDALALPGGEYLIEIEATTKKRNRHTLRVPLRIDHAKGFASPYHRWIAEFENRDPEAIAYRLDTLESRPLISVIVPVYRTPPGILKRTVNSVLRQSYPQWELLMIDDGSASDEISRSFDEFESRDPRIRCFRLQRNSGISGASNVGLEAARGAFTALLDHDDELSGDALFHVVCATEDHPDADLFYSDEDHIDEQGRRFDPFFKPDWSPDLILSENYVCHLLVFRTETARRAGGFRSETDLSQDHDILLRLSRTARKIIHIPKILYHWRTEVDTLQRASNQEQRALASSFRAVHDFVQQTAGGARVEEGRVPGRWRVRYPLPSAVHVSVLIPSGGKLDVLRRNLDSLFTLSDFQEFEVVVIDNSRADRILQYVTSLQANGRPVRYIDERGKPFNYSRLNNVAAADCSSELLLFLNDDTELLESGGLTALVELACRSEAGAVGAKLLYPDGRIQHGGVVMGIFGLCGHAFKGLFASDRSYFDFPDVIRNVSAVTGACMMVRREVFREIDGFDEKAFPVAYNDVDLCLRIGARGYRVLYTPHALFTHYEAFSKHATQLDPDLPETEELLRRWGGVIAHDPFYSPNLSRTEETWSLRRRLEIPETHGHGLRLTPSGRAAEL